MYEINKSINIKCSREVIFSALTTSDVIPQYFPLKNVESEWKLGSDVLYRGEINDAPFTDFGVITKFDVPSNYTYTYWSDNHGTERLPENYLTISYSLIAKDDSTELTVVQSNINSLEMYDIMNNQVWEFLLNSLKQYVETRT